MNLLSLTASSHLPAIASCTASSAYWDRGLRCSVVSVFNAGALLLLSGLEGMLSIRSAELEKRLSSSCADAGLDGELGRGCRRLRRLRPGCPGGAHRKGLEHRRGSPA